MSAAQKPRTTTAAKSESVSTAADTTKGTATKGDKGTDAPKEGLGKVAYEAYTASFDGGLESWDDLHTDSPDEATAWEAAAQAVLTATFGRK